MTFTESPKRQPAETRQQLLDVAGKTILEKGLSALTLEGVARAAGVSKGGLLHHFPSKQQLIDALIIDLHHQFRRKWQTLVDADPVDYGKEIRAYLALATRERDEHAFKLCNILAVEDRQNRTMHDLWREFLATLLQSSERSGIDAATAAVVQLAVDGLWLAELEGILIHTSDLQKKVVERLQQMTYPPEDERKEKTGER